MSEPTIIREFGHGIRVVREDDGYRVHAGVENASFAVAAEGPAVMLGAILQTVVDHHRRCVHEYERERGSLIAACMEAEGLAPEDSIAYRIKEGS